MRKDDDINHSKDLGDKGEEIAAAFLIRKGYQIKHRNWHFGHKEIDIVAQKDGQLIIVEVKTRTSSNWEEPKESVRQRKQRYIIEAAEEYVQKYNIDMDVQFDIVSVLLQGKEPDIEHIEDAFQPRF